MKALRQYEDITIDVNDVDLHFNDLNHSNRIQYFSIRLSREFRAPILPSLIEFRISRDSGDVDLRNLIYSSSLKTLTVDECYYTVLIPNQLKKRGVIIEDHYAPCFIGDDEMGTMKEIHDSHQDDNINIYDEDEVTVYGD